MARRGRPGVPWGVASPRLDELTEGEFEPLSDSELKSLRASALDGDEISIGRLLLARLLVERDAALCLAETAKMVVEELEATGLLEPPEDGTEETDLARYGAALRRFTRRAER